MMDQICIEYLWLVWVATQILRKNCFPARINCLSVPFEIVYI